MNFKSKVKLRIILSLFLIFISRIFFAQSPFDFGESGSGSYTWICPAGVTFVTVEVYGAGGAGGSSNYLRLRHFLRLRISRS
jgi:hypothetical protein